MQHSIAKCHCFYIAYLNISFELSNLTNEKAGFLREPKQLAKLKKTYKQLVLDRSHGSKKNIFLFKQVQVRPEAWHRMTLIN